MATESLINKYRPLSFNEVVGHTDVVRALQAAMNGPSPPHSYLLTGIRGLGKTTIARLIAKQFDCEVVEIDAATYSKVEDIRTIVELGQHISIWQEGGNRLILVDEVHRLSANAMDAFLKLTEEPPDHLYICFCTTNTTRLPATMVSRCYPVQLKPIRRDYMNDLLNAIADLEGWDVDTNVMNSVVTAAEGSPRTALTILQAVHDSNDVEEATRIVTLQEAGEPLIELCQALLANVRDWPRLQTMLLKMAEEDDFENSVTIAARYIAGSMIKAKDKKRATEAWIMLDALVAPMGTFDRKVAFLNAVGRILFATGG
jgi:DNA polymerase-3 subunit gamma/tau